MKNCSKCNEPLVEGSKFCNACGAPADTVKTEAELIAEEQAVLNRIGRVLKYERLAWKISGIFSIIAAAYFLMGAFLIPICGMDAYSPATAHEFVAITVLFLFCVLCILPIIIVNFTMTKKLGKYRAKLFTDCNDGISHCGVGSIILAALFNEVALVFAIINFVQVKSNAAVIERIKTRQAQFNSQK